MTSFTLHEPRFTVHEIKGGDNNRDLTLPLAREGLTKKTGWETRQKSTSPCHQPT